MKIFPSNNFSKNRSGQPVISKLVREFLDTWAVNGLTHSYLELNLKIDVCIHDTFENNFEIDAELKKMFMESSRSSSDQHFSFKYFPV